MLRQTAQFLLDMLLGPYAFLLLFRFILHLARAPLRNPLGDLVCLLTNPLVLPLRRVLPALGRLDLASLFLAFCFEIVLLTFSLLLLDRSLDNWLWPLLALFRLFRACFYILIFALALEALLSWSYPNAPFAPLLRSITGPFLRPLHRLAPPKGGVDFAFLILFILCAYIVTVPFGWLELTILHAISSAQ